jgi:SAM-dependent methyltransferase
VSTDLYADADLYDLLHDGYRDDLGFYRGLAEDFGGPVLELGAGSGRVTVALARAGFEVVAVEPAAAMRARGAARLAAAGVADLVAWLEADARALALGRRFPLVIAPFHMLMHLATLDDQDAALGAAHAHVASGGAFATDVYVPRFGPDGVVRVEPAWAGLEGDLSTWQVVDPVAQTVVTEHRLDRTRADGTVHRRAATLRQRYFHRFELERALRAAGFGRVRTFGGFDRGPVTIDASSWTFLAHP